MKWKEIFETGIEMGHAADVRNLDNPRSYKGNYADCRIIHGDGDKEVNTLYIAVDAGVPEMLVVQELNKKGKNIDGILIHHPTGASKYRLTEVIEIQKYNWIRCGVNPAKAEKIYDDMIEKETIRLKAGNHLAVENAASFLSLAVMCMHTAIDNIVQAFFENLCASWEYDKVSDLFKKIESLPECVMASQNGDSPYIIGQERSNLGKVMVDMTGGIDPDSAIFRYIKKAGIDTLIAMHYSKENIKYINKYKINVIITGHMASDSIGLNIFCSRLEEKGIDIIAGPGLYQQKKNQVVG